MNTFNKKSKLFKNYLNNAVVSFLTSQSQEQIKKAEENDSKIPVFIWQGERLLIFDESTVIDTGNLPGLDRISNLIRFSIVAKAKLSENPNGIATITSHSSCGCWVL